MSIPHTTHYGRTKGFTLIETIVSISLLAIGVVAPLSLAASGIHASYDAVFELEATHLAQEGVEVIHSMRSNNSASDISPDHSGWDTAPVAFMINARCGHPTKPCGVDVTRHTTYVWGTAASFRCDPGSDCERLFYNPNTGLYRQDIANPGAPYVVSPFRRSIKVDKINAHQIHIVSTVTYNGQGGRVRTIVATDDLYNWFPCLLSVGCP